MDELFTAIRGKGAFLNGKPINTSSQNELVKSLLVRGLKPPLFFVFLLLAMKYLIADTATMIERTN
ncbi:hypothetical protein ABFS83_07G081300 [Erythranthe nasuta]